GEAAARGVEARALVPEDAGRRPLRTAVRVLRGPADGQWTPGHPSRVRAHHQGSGVPLPHDAGAGRDAHRRVDTHGLPVEIEVERMLGISGKKQIEAYGVEK